MDTAAAHDAHAAPEGDVEPGSASGGVPEAPAAAPAVEAELPDTTDEDGTPLENPSGG